MINIEKAKETVIAFLHKKAPPGKVGCVIIDSKTYETRSGWVFSWLPKKIFDAKGEDGVGIGNMPILVDRFDGSVHVLRPPQTIEQFAQDYERRKKK